MLRWLPWVLFLSFGGAVGETTLVPPPVEPRMEELKRRIAESRKNADWDAAQGLIGEMAALDHQHPKPFIELVLLQRSRKALDDVPRLMDSLGLAAEGPGRRYGEGMLAYFRGHPENAEARFREALRLYELRGHAAGQAASHTALGILHSDARRYGASAAEYASALALLRRIGDQAGAADVRGNLARLDRRRGDLEAALEEQRRILTEREELGDEPGQAHAWYEIGSSLKRSGDLGGAVAALERAAALYAGYGENRDRLSTLRRLAAIELDSGHGAAAVQRLREALAVAGDLSATLEARVARQLGETLIETGRVREGLARLDLAASYFAARGMKHDKIATRTSIGHGMTLAGEPGAALELLQGELLAAEQLADTELVASVCTALGNATMATGELTRGLGFHERALDAHRTVGDPDGQRIAHNNLGAAYFALGDLGRSREQLEESAKLAGESNDREDLARARNNLAVLLSEEGSLDPALEEAAGAIGIWHELGDVRGTAVGRLTAATIHLRLGKVEEAAAGARRARESFRTVEDRRGEASAGNLLGEARLAAGDPAGARDAHRSALELSRRHDLPAQRWRSHGGLAAALAAEGKQEAALGEALRAIDEIEDVRGGLELDVFKMRFLDDKLRYYERAVELLLGGNRAREPDAVSRSFALAERARARSLLELLTEAGHGLRAGIDPALRAQEREILDDLSAARVELASSSDSATRDDARKRVREAERALEQLELRMRRGAPLYGEIVYPRPATLEQTRSEILGEGETLLQYLVGDERAWLWSVSRDRAELFPLAAPTEIEAAATSFVEAARTSAAALTAGAPDEAAAERLAAAILPAGALVDGYRLLIAPDGPLHHVPFAALRRRGRFLIEDHEIAVVPSATILRLLRTQPGVPGAGGLLAVADPVPAEGDDRFPRLPYSRQEADAIAALFPEPTPTVLAGDGATKEALRALDLERYRLVHFATHGWLDDDGLRHSGLRLSASGGDAATSLLSAEEILTLRLSADIVVLSACSSGQGELLRGEGLVSLTRAFLYAGARSVLVSLWNVDDVSTADLMRSFYERIEAGESPAAALRYAQMTFLESGRAARRAARSWAPFIAVGNPGYPAVNRTVAATSE